MSLMKIAVKKTSSLAKIKFGIWSLISKLDLCEGESLIFNSDIQLSVYSFSCFISVFVALLKATYADNLNIVLSCRY